MFPSLGTGRGWASEMCVNETKLHEVFRRRPSSKTPLIHYCYGDSSNVVRGINLFGKPKCRTELHCIVLEASQQGLLMKGSAQTDLLVEMRVIRKQQQPEDQSTKSENTEREFHRAVA